jgi:hypothetical protein
MPPAFNFRLNGQVFPMIIINREKVDGKLTGRRHISAWLDGVGRLLLDDDDLLWERTHPPHVLEYRNETAWQGLSPQERQSMQNDGWRKASPDELVQILIAQGVIRWE